MPKLSVIVPTFNRQVLLEKAIKSIQNQDFKDLEIIVSDDNSSDDTKSVVQNLQKDDDRIKYFLNQNYKQGPNGNKNNGLDQASGEFVTFLDDDDELLSGALSTLMQKANEGYAHVFGNCLIEKEGNLSKEFSGKGLEKDSEISKKDFLMAKFSGEFFSVFKNPYLKISVLMKNFMAMKPRFG